MEGIKIVSALEDLQDKLNEIKTKFHNSVCIAEKELFLMEQKATEYDKELTKRVERCEEEMTTINDALEQFRSSFDE